jgi:spore coat polysaccharide biosynthesis protein SpsF
MRAGGRPLLQILIARLQQVPEIDEVVVATTTNTSDDAVAAAGAQAGAGIYRGSEHDVLGRVRRALDAANADTAVEITGDCPLIDPVMVSSCIMEFRATADRHAYLANTTGPTLGAPHGLDVQVFDADALREIDAETDNPDHREHVSLPFYDPDGVARWRPRFLSFFPEELCRRVWLSVDYPEDYALIKAAYEALSARDEYFGAIPLIEFCLAEKELTAACLHRRASAE